LGVISVICGAETWKQMRDIAQSKEVFLKKFLELPNRIPSDNTINRGGGLSHRQLSVRSLLYRVAIIKMRVVYTNVRK